MCSRSQLEQDRHGGDVSISGGDNLFGCLFIKLRVCSYSSYIVQSPGQEQKRILAVGKCMTLPMVAKSLDEKIKTISLTCHT